MKPISLLKYLITAYYYLIKIVLMVFPIIFIIFITTGKLGNLKLNIFDNVIDYNNLNTPHLIVINILGFSLLFVFLIGLAKIKNSMSDLESGNFFSIKVIENFRTAGKIFLFSGFAKFVIKPIISLFILDTIKIELGSSIFLLIIMGLFFMFLSEVFAKARQIKSDNDLTI